jgi:hypothetical protein
VVCISLCFVAVTPSVVQAREAQCEHSLIHDWYADGQIQGRYRVICYRAALADVPADEVIYRTVRSDLAQALSSGIARVKQEGVTARPKTLLPAPQTLLATSPITKSQKSHSMLALAALAILLVLLLVWCVARWRSNRLIR